MTPQYTALLVLALSWSTAAFVVPEEEESEKSFKSCHLASGKPGLCVPYKQCSVLVELIGNLQKPLPGDVGQLIRDSFFCGFEDGVGLTVCCQLNGIEPEPQVGANDLLPDRGSCLLQSDVTATCIPYQECSPFVQMLSNLRRPLPPAVPSIMQNAYLCDLTQLPNGRSNPSICCPSAAISSTTPTTTPTPTTNSTTEGTKELPKPTVVPFSDHPKRNLLASADDCGISLLPAPPRIVGGEDAKPGQFPWLANLGYKLSGNPKVQFRCGGSLIGSRYILTAAHCVVNLPAGFTLSVVRLGENDLDSDDPDCFEDNSELCAPPVQDFVPEEIIAHEEYNKPGLFRHDIALIRLDRPAEIHDYVSPVCLPYDHQRNESYLDHKIYDLEPFVAGWGAVDVSASRFASVLQYVDIPLWEFDKCSEFYKTQGLELRGGQFCAGGEADKDSCAGDSGSALMNERLINRAPRWEIFGVVSFGPRRCATKNVPAVYTRVREYIPWILDNIKE